MGEVEIAAQHGHVQIILPEDAAHIGSQPLRQSGIIKGDAFDAFGQSQMHAGKPLLPGFFCPRFQRLPVGGEGGIHIMETDAELYILCLSIYGKDLRRERAAPGKSCSKYPIQTTSIGLFKLKFEQF